MSTFIQLQDRISEDYLNRSDFTTQVKRAIQAAVRHYERKRWDFNETAGDLTTSAGQTYVSLPSNFLILDDLKITVSSNDLDMRRRSPKEIRKWNASRAQGQPTDFAVTRNRIELFPIPDTAWSLPIYYIKELPALSADADSNGWTDGLMEDVIVYHATKLLWANVLRNDAEAAKFAALERTAMMNITSHHEQHVLNKIEPTSF